MKRDYMLGLAWNRFAGRQASNFIHTAILALATVIAAMAFTPQANAQSVIRISADHGGSISARVKQIRTIQASGQRVEIRNGFCNSACTMYLGLPETCVSPRATFGFHGPQSATKGLSLLPNDFERYSREMARHYPPALRGWFMQEARYSRKLIKVSGAQLIRLGVPQCA